MNTFKKHSVLIFTFILLLTLLFASFYPSKEGMFWHRFQPQSVESGNAYSKYIATNNAYKLQKQQIKMAGKANIRAAQIAARDANKKYVTDNRANVTTDRTAYGTTVRTDYGNRLSDNISSFFKNLSG